MPTGRAGIRSRRDLANPRPIDKRGPGTRPWVVWHVAGCRGPVSATAKMRSGAFPWPEPFNAFGRRLGRHGGRGGKIGRASSKICAGRRAGETGGKAHRRQRRTARAAIAVGRSGASRVLKRACNRTRVWRERNCAVPIAGTMLAEMQRVRSVVAKILLLAAAAVQPLAFALSLTLAVGHAATDASALGPLVICTAHGAAVSSQSSDEQKPAPPPGQKPPDCTYCTVVCQGASLKALPASGVPVWHLPQRRLDLVDDRTEDPGVTPRLLRLVTSPPRAPPSLA